MCLLCSSWIRQRSNTLILIFWRSLFSCLSYLRTESSSLSMNKILGFMDVCSQLQSSISLLTWTAGNVWMMSPKPGRGQEQMWASQMDPVNNGLNHRGRPVHVNISSLFLACFYLTPKGNFSVQRRFLTIYNLNENSQCNQKEVCWLLMKRK